MSEETGAHDSKTIASELVRVTRSLPLRNTDSERAVLRGVARRLKTADADTVLETARALIDAHDFHWQAYELIRSHPGAFRRMGPVELEEFGRGIDSWWTVDAFARTLSGPAWIKGQVTDEFIHRWASSPDFWWRRAALVSTVVWNMRSQGGRGDTPRTLAVCRLLAADHEDMVVKALSWALRELVVHDARAVEAFLAEYDGVLAGRIKREVRSKLNTGLKNPRRKKPAPSPENPSVPE